MLQLAWNTSFYQYQIKNIKIGYMIMCIDKLCVPTWLSCENKCA